MISEIFALYYTTDMHPERLKPLSKDELCKGMSRDAADKYLSLVKQLYDSFSFDVNARFIPPSREVIHQRSTKRAQIYTALLSHLFKCDAISDSAYIELHKAISVEFNFLERPDKPAVYVSDSFDDFRLAFERSILENDSNIDMCDSYLDDRYGYSICVRPNTPNRPIQSSDLQIIRFEGKFPDIHSVEASYWEVRQLLKRVQCDIEHNTNEQTRLNTDFCKPKSKYSYTSSFQKSAYPSPNNIAEWYSIKRALEVEASNLSGVENEVRRIFDTMKKPTDTVGLGASLYIYKGKIICHQQNHPIVSATAILHDEYDREIEIDVEYCPKCKRYMLNHTSFEHYRERYGVLIGKLRMLSSNGLSGEFDMALESPLKLCGYSVSQVNGLSPATRQFILAKIIHDRIMSKPEVIHYLEHFIRLNGSKHKNSLALEKWHEDLDFVHKYDIKIQPRVYIATIKSY